MHDDVIPFENALALTEPGKRHLLLGNGFSIDCRHDIFDYRRLLDQADFSAAHCARRAFDKLGTSDFERVVRALRDFAHIAPLYGADGTQAAKDADSTREILIETIQERHPAQPNELLDAEFEKCWDFLTHFNSIFTLNYDLLLYWTQMHHLQKGGGMQFSDGFKGRAQALVWSAEHYDPCRTFFLHGGLHLFEVDRKPQKRTWGGSEPPILVQVAEAIRSDRYPLFVCEGKAEEKLAVIKRSNYLTHGFKELGSLDGSLFIFGHSLREEDKHILDQIKASNISKLLVSVRLADGPESVADLQGRGVALAKKAGIDDHLTFFNADTAHVWK